MYYDAVNSLLSKVRGDYVKVKLALNMMKIMLSEISELTI